MATATTFSRRSLLKAGGALIVSFVIPKYVPGQNAPAAPADVDGFLAIHGDGTIVPASRKRVFLRNVFTEPASNQSSRSGSNCADISAPLYTDWLSGPCATSGPPVVITYDGDFLCPSLQSADAAREGGHLRRAECPFGQRRKCEHGGECAGALMNSRHRCVSAMG